MRGLVQHLLMREHDEIYGIVQITAAYNSNKIEGGLLSEEQVTEIFRQGQVMSGDFRNKDVEEMQGHFKMFDYMLDSLGKPLSPEIIKGMHCNLKEDVFEDLANGYIVGDWKTRRNTVGGITIALPDEVPKRIEELVVNKVVTIEDIARFHVEFERIHPFQDGNGRVGRMIILKQCLDNNLIPIIIMASDQEQYYRSLVSAQNQKDYSMLVELFKKEQEKFKMRLRE